MFQQLTEKLALAFRTIRGLGAISEANIAGPLRDIRRALLEADVHFKVARDLIDRVRSQAQGERVLRSISPGQQIIKIFHDELVAVLGGTAADLPLPTDRSHTVMLMGLQGAGKTTVCGKLARHYRERGHRPALLALDPYRPAAEDQLRTLGRQLDVPVWGGGAGDVPGAARAGRQRAR